MRMQGAIAIGVVLGMGLTLLWQKAMATHQWSVVHAQGNPKEGTPGPHRIAQLGPAVVPDLCMEIADRWTPDQNIAPVKLITWLRAIGEIGDPRAVPTLIGLADHRNRSIRLYTALAMSKMGDTRCIPALLRLSEDVDGHVAWAAKYALDRVPKD